MTDYLDPFRDSLVVRDVAQGILTVLSVANGEPAALLLSQLSAAERCKYQSLACLVLRSSRGEAVNLATWHAARVLAREVFHGQDFEDLSWARQLELRVWAATACAAYVQHLKGLVYPTEVAKAEALSARTLAKLTETPAEPEAGPELPPPDASFAVGMKAAAAVRPFVKREPR